MSIRVRDTTPEEAPAIRELLEAHAQVSFGETELSEEEIRHLVFPADALDPGRRPRR